MLIALAIGGLPLPSAQAQGTQRSKRDFSTSETNTTEIFRSLNQLGSRNDSLRRLDEELSKSSLPFSSRRSLESESLSSGPLPVATVQPRRKKTDLSHTDGWFSNPDENLPGGATKNSLEFPGFDSDKADPKRGSWEQIYQRLKKEDSTGTGLGTAVKSHARQPSDSEEDNDSDLPAAIKDNAAFLKKQLKESDFGTSIFAPTTARGSLSDFFGVGAKEMTPEQAKAHKASMDTFVTSVFGDSSPAAAVYSDMRLGSSSDPRKNPNSSPLDSLPTVSRGDSSRPGSLLNASLSPSTMPDLNSKVLNQWNPMYTEPKLELPKPQPLFTPPIEAPRRRF